MVKKEESSFLLTTTTLTTTLKKDWRISRFCPIWERLVLQVPLASVGSRSSESAHYTSLNIETLRSYGEPINMPLRSESFLQLHIAVHLASSDSFLPREDLCGVVARLFRGSKRLGDGLVLNPSNPGESTLRGVPKVV